MNGRKTVFFTFLNRGFSAILTFVNSVITARYLPAANRGDFQLTTSYATLGQRFSGGYSNYFSRTLPRREGDAVQIVQMGNLIMFLLSIFVWLISIGIAWFGHPSTVVLYSIIGMPFTFLFGYASRLLNAMDEIKALNRANLAQATSFMAIYLLFILLHWHLDPSHRLLWTYRLWLLSWIICVVMTLFTVYRSFGWGEHIKWKWHRSEWKAFLVFGTWSSLAMLSGYVNLRIDFWMLKWVLPDTDHTRTLVGVYSIAVTAAEILVTLSQSISTVVFRKMSASDDDEASVVTEVASRQTLISSIIIAFVLAIAMPFLVFVYGSGKYGGAVGPFYILLPGLIIKTVSSLISQYFTNTKGKPVTLLVVDTLIIAVNVAICFSLIPHFGMYGASAASTIAYFVEMAAYVYWYRQTSHRSGRNLWRLRGSDLRPYAEMAGGLIRKARAKR